MDPLLFAVPVFLLLIVVEASVAHFRGVSPYDLRESLSNIACGALDLVVNLFSGAAFLILYNFCELRLGVLHIERTSVVAWISLVLAHDFLYYVFHRTSHSVNFMWTAHVVHHQGERYNLSLSLRQGTVATWFTFAFYLPLAFAGFPVEMFVVVHGAYQIYQFFVHTRFVRSLGPLEWILATPSLHRVHHGREAHCLDKNFGGFFNVWDRLFGSYAVECGDISFGTGVPIKRWDPFWANTFAFVALARATKRAGSARKAAAILFGPPRATE